MPRISYNVTSQVRKKAAVRWNTLYRMRVPDYSQSYYPRILQPATHPITAKTNPWSTRITWNFTDPVSVIKAIKWNTLNNGSKRVAVKWNTIGRSNMQQAVRFNDRNSVTSTTVVKWNTGPVTQPFIKQVSMSREDFAY